MTPKTTWKDYEDAVYNMLYYHYRPPLYLVRRDVRDIRGRYSKSSRQMDVVVYRDENFDHPMLAVECKFYKRKLHVKDVEAFIGMMDDIGADEGMLVSLKGFARSAERRASAANLRVVTLSLGDAIRLNWRELARRVFPYDEQFHPEMGDALYELDTADDLDTYVEFLEDLPFEEWDAVLETYFQKNRDRCITALENIARYHSDDGWRFNAIRILVEHKSLEQKLQSELLQVEIDLETIELLQSVS